MTKRNGSVRYFLSNRQAKELMIRGAQLTIALPAPLLDHGDAKEWAAQSLANVEREWIHGVAEEWLAVDPTVGKSEEDNGSLPATLGLILDEEQAAHRWHVCVAVYLVTLSRDASPPWRRQRPQWPARVETLDAPRAGR